MRFFCFENEVRAKQFPDNDLFGLENPPQICEYILTMKDFIKIQDQNLLLINTKTLGLKEAQLWIGPNPNGPSDNNDERVLKERAKMEADKDKPNQRISGIEVVNLIESET